MTSQWSLVMNFPDLPDNHFGPFLSVCGEVSQNLSQLVPQIPDPRKRLMLEQMLEGFKQSLDGFTSTAIPEFERTHKKLQESTAKTMDLLEDHKALTARMREISDDLKAKVKAADSVEKQPRKPPARPTVSPPSAKKAAPLLDGNTLRSFLLGLRDQGEEALQGPHTTGNIWDNWKPGDTGGKPRA